MNLFTYGSLMFPEIWQHVAGQTFPTRPATLPDHAAWQISGQTYPGLTHTPGHLTAGIVHLDVHPAAAARLDAFEGPLYIRTPVRITLEIGSPLDAFTYLVAPAHHHLLEPTLWNAEFFRSHHLPHFLHPGT